MHKIVTVPGSPAPGSRSTAGLPGPVNARSGRGKTITIVNDQVTIDLAPFIAIVKQDLSARGFTLVHKLPPIHPTLALFSAKARRRHRRYTG